jgi:hypothetical protein
MKTQPKVRSRYTIVSVPKSGEPASWFVFDRHEMKSVMKCEDYDAAMDCCRLANGK